MINERQFLAAVVALHSVQGCPPRAITAPKVLAMANSLSKKSVEKTLLLMQRSDKRATMRRCIKLHKQLWEVYQSAKP